MLATVGFPTLTVFFLVLPAGSAADHPASYLVLVQAGLEIRRHVDLLDWLQGDVQRYLPHDILMTGWPWEKPIPKSAAS